MYGTFRDTADCDALQARSAVGPHDDQAGVLLDCRFHDALEGLAEHDPEFNGMMCQAVRQDRLQRLVILLALRTDHRLDDPLAGGLDFFGPKLPIGTQLILLCIAAGIPVAENPARPLRHGAPPSGGMGGDSLLRPRVSDFQLRPVHLGKA